MTTKTLIEVKSTAFWLDNALSCAILALHFKVEEGHWYELIVSDGRGSIKTDEEPQPSAFESMGSQFRYEVQDFNQLDFKAFGKLQAAQQLLYQGQQDECFGFELQFENQQSVWITEQDDDLSVSSDPPQMASADYST